MIQPEATLGVLGGGQLGRMFAVAARTMGYRVTVLSPVGDSPAGSLADTSLRAAYDDPDALDTIARTCAAVTVEFENVPAHSLEILSERVPVRPGAAALRQAQDRAREKACAQAAGLATTPWAPVPSAGALGEAWQAIGGPAVLKRATQGYDGKGQRIVATRAEAEAAFAALGHRPCVLEHLVDLASEVSVVLARGADGEHAAFPIAENEHRDGILHLTVAPAPISPALAARAKAMAVQLADALDYVGVLAVELFVRRDGTLLFNEMAPRPHNSGHYTLDACRASQFEQQVRALCGLGLADPSATSAAAMVNLLGDLWDGDTPPDWTPVLRHPRAKLHLYGKAVARPGRKMGHVTVLADDPQAARSDAVALYEALRGG